MGVYAIGWSPSKTVAAAILKFVDLAGAFSASGSCYPHGAGASVNWGVSALLILMVTVGGSLYEVSCSGCLRFATPGETVQREENIAADSGSRNMFLKGCHWQGREIGESAHSSTPPQASWQHHTGLSELTGPTSADLRRVSYGV